MDRGTTAIDRLNTIEEIKRRLPILEAVERYGQAELKRSGSNYFIRCIYHDERTPSMSIKVDDDRFYCFGCHRGGDQIDFVAGVLGMSNPDAVKYLAQELGIDTRMTDDERRALEKKHQAAQAEREKREADRSLTRAQVQMLSEACRKIEQIIRHQIRAESDLDKRRVQLALRYRSELNHHLDEIFGLSEQEQSAYLAGLRSWSFWRVIGLILGEV